MAHPDGSRPTESLGLEESVRFGRVTLALTGELIMETAPLLDEAIERLCTNGSEELLLDIRALHFMDSSGLQSLLKAVAVCEAHGCIPLLTQSGPQINRLFVLTGLTRRLQLIDPSE
jgi:anti-anti-sigma factor